MIGETSKSVLIIDDDDTARAFVEAIMSGEGWETIEAINGEEGLDLAESEKPALIILDVMMPGIDGIETFKRLRESPFTDEIPVIMLTAVEELEPGAKLNESFIEKNFGGNRPEGFVNKPVGAKFLLDTIFGVVG